MEPWHKPYRKFRPLKTLPNGI